MLLRTISNRLGFPATRLRAAVVIVTALGLLSLGLPAANAGEEPEVVVPVTTIGESEIREATTEGRSPRTIRRVLDFLEEQARRGRNLDLDEIRSAAITTDAGEVQIVWEQAVGVTAVGVSESEDARGLGVSLAETGEGESASAAPPGMGMAAFNNVRNGTRVGGTCTSVSANGNRATSCYEKWKLAPSNGLDRWAYDRWGTGVPAGGWKPTEVTLRSRPWSGTLSRLRQFNDYWPRGGGNVCPGGNPVASIGYGGFSASIPISQCQVTTVDPNASAFSMMSKWLSPSIVSSTTAKSSDFAVILSTTQGQTLTMADYIWTSYLPPWSACRTCYVTAWRDSGW